MFKCEHVCMKVHKHACLYMWKLEINSSSFLSQSLHNNNILHYYMIIYNIIILLLYFETRSLSPSAGLADQ